jgi:hypothetical protein
VEVTLTYGDNTITLDLHCSVTWALTSSKQLGTARVWIPDGSPARSIVSDEEPGLIEIYDRRLGTWRGIATRPSFDEMGNITLGAVHLHAWATIRPVGRSRVFDGLTAGAIARVAAIDALVGLGATTLQLGTFYEGAPIIPHYEFRGQSAAQVFGDLADATGQEWAISDTGALSWLPPQGALYERQLCDGGDLVGASRDVDFSDRLAGVIVRDNFGREITATAADNMAGYWPRVDVQAGQTTGAVRAGVDAARQLAARRHADAVLRIQLYETPRG